MEFTENLQITSTDHSVTVVRDGNVKDIFPKDRLCVSVDGGKIIIYGYGNLGVMAYDGVGANLSDIVINGEQATVENIEALIEDAFYRMPPEPEVEPEVEPEN